MEPPRLTGTIRGPIAAGNGASGQGPDADWITRRLKILRRTYYNFRRHHLRLRAAAYRRRVEENVVSTVSGNALNLGYV
jgi:hypothetical protein